MKLLAITVVLCILAGAFSHTDKDKDGDKHGHGDEHGKDHDKDHEHDKEHGKDHDKDHDKHHGKDHDKVHGEGGAHVENELQVTTGSKSLSGIDYSGETVIEEKKTERFVLSWLEKAWEGLQAGAGFAKFPPLEGTLNLLLTGVLNNVKGTAKGLEPSVQAVYVTPIPTLRIILAAAKIKVCGPQTHLEFLLNHVICFVNGPLYVGANVAPIPFCIKGKEVQCYGPFMRLPDTLTPEEKEAGTWNGGDAGVKNVELTKVDESGKPIEVVQSDIGETTTTNVESSGVSP